MGFLASNQDLSRFARQPVRRRHWRRGGRLGWEEGPKMHYLVTCNGGGRPDVPVVCCLVFVRSRKFNSWPVLERGQEYCAGTLRRAPLNLTDFYWISFEVMELRDKTAPSVNRAVGQTLKKKKPKQTASGGGVFLPWGHGRDGRGLIFITCCRDLSFFQCCEISLGTGTQSL